MTENSTPSPSKELGQPYCGQCGYLLQGLTDSTRCPECGTPLVDAIQRRSQSTGRRYTSQTRVFGQPLIAIAYGPHGNEQRGHARGIIAIGDIATGWLAIGQIARGLIALGSLAIGIVSFGGFSLGLLLALGGFALGGVSTGGFSAGGYATGGFSVGLIANGGTALGYYAKGGVAGGRYVLSAKRNDPEARSLYDALSLNGTSPRVEFVTRVHVYAGLLALSLVVLLVLIVAYGTRGSP